MNRQSRFDRNGTSGDPDRSAGYTGPYPSSPTEIFREATPKGIPYPGSHCLAPTGSSLAEPSGYVLIFIIVLGCVYLLPSLAPPQAQVNKRYFSSPAFVNFAQPAH